MTGLPRRVTRWLMVGLVLLTGSTLLSACSTNHGDKDIVRQAIARTRLLSRKFVYQEKPLAAQSVEVDGFVEDDFRYAANLKLDSAPVREEVASDDALAIRFPDGSQARRFLDNAGASASATTRPGDLPTSQAVGVLEAGQWVQDDVGAPSLIVAANDKRKVGDDPILDSLTVFDYLDKAVQVAPKVQKFDPDSLSPIFKAKEDPFPKPKRGAPIVRYDLDMTPLPKAAAGPGSRAVLPDITNFRKMVIYVKDGLVVRAMEVVDVASKLQDLKRNFKISDDITVTQAVDGLNQVRRFAGQDPIRVRSMSIELQDLGAPEHVEMPAGAAHGNLAVVRFRGKVTTTSTAPTATPTAAGSDSTSSTAAQAPPSA